MKDKKRPDGRVGKPAEEAIFIRMWDLATASDTTLAQVGRSC